MFLKIITFQAAMKRCKFLNMHRGLYNWLRFVQGTGEWWAAHFCHLLLCLYLKIRDWNVQKVTKQKNGKFWYCLTFAHLKKSGALFCCGHCPFLKIRDWNGYNAKKWAPPALLVPTNLKFPNFATENWRF